MVFNQFDARFGHDYGTRFYTPFKNFNFYTVYDRDKPFMNVSLSKISFLLKDLKAFLLEKGHRDVYFAQSNLLKYDLSKILNLIDKIFHENDWNICVCQSLINEGNVRVNNFQNSINHYTPIIPIQINESQSAALIDTGADVCLVDAAFIKENNIKYDSTESISVRGISGNFVKVCGFVHMPVTIANIKVMVKLYIVQNGNLSVPFLFGCDFLSEYHCIINFKDKTVTFENEMVPCLTPDSELCVEDDEYQLHLAQDVVLKPRSSKLIKFNLKTNNNYDYFYIKEINPLLNKIGMVMPFAHVNCILPIHDKSLSLEILNTSNAIRNIKKEFKISKVKMIKSMPSILKFSKNVHCFSLNTDKTNSTIKNYSSDFFNDVLKNVSNQNDIKNFTQVLNENIEAFAKDENDVGLINHYQHRIDLIDDVPVVCRAYRTPHSKIKVVDKEIDRLLKCGIIRESKSAYSAPCLVVWKKSGKPRLVIDFRKLNLRIKPIRYPLPHLESSLQLLGGNKYFSTLDLVSGYHQIPLRNCDAEKTAFSTGRGLYEFTRMPMGMVSSSAGMQYAMERVLGPLIGKACHVYIDDIIVMGKDEVSHDRNLHLVLEKLRNAGFKLNIKKCEFRKSEISCLGHIISGKGISPHPSRVDALTNKKEPRNLKDLRSFLGLASYYRRFIPDYSKIALPLTQLTKSQTKWDWNENCKNAYKTLIDKTINAPILSYPDFKKEFVITTDASTEGIGAVLSQNHDGVQKPIAFYSRALNGAEQRYSIHELEGLAIKAALNKFRFVVLGYPITVRTDNQPIIYLFKSNECHGRLAKYLAAIQEFNVKLVYLPGKENCMADFLSRNVNYFSINNVFDKTNLMIAQQNDSVLQNLLKMVKYKNIIKEYDRVIYYNDHIYIPLSLRNDYIRYFHENLGCHEGIFRTTDRMKKYVYWPQMEIDIKKFINDCNSCKMGKPSHFAKNVLGKFPPVSSPFMRVHVDLMGPLKTTFKKNKYLFVAIDAFSHWCVVKPIKTKDAKNIVKIFDEEVVQKFNTPWYLVSDMGKEFTADVFQNYCRDNGIRLHWCSPYHHSSNGLAERLNLQIGNALRCCLLDSGGNWDDYIDRIVLSLNTTCHGATKLSPYEILNNKLFKVDLPCVYTSDSNIERNNRKLFNRVGVILNKTDSKMRFKFNIGKRNRTFNLNDKVFVRIPERSHKLSPIFKGPCRIVGIDPSGFSYNVLDPQGVVSSVHVNHIR